MGSKYVVESAIFGIANHNLPIHYATFMGLQWWLRVVYSWVPPLLWLLKKCSDLLSPFLTALCNTSLQNGTVPASFKTAVVTPSIKKSSMDVNTLQNYRPISKSVLCLKVAWTSCQHSATIACRHSFSASSKLISIQTRYTHILFHGAAYMVVNRTTRLRPRTDPWFDNDCWEAKKRERRLERRYKRHGSDCIRGKWTNALRD